MTRVAEVRRHAKSTRVDFKQVADRRGAPDAMAAIVANTLGTSSGGCGSQRSASAMREVLLGAVPALSGGRVILGVGAGHVEGEFDALGVPFAERGALHRRGDRRRSSRPGPTSSPTSGPHWPAHESVSGRVRCSSRGRRSGSAVRVEPALRRVAARGDGWIPQGTPRKQMPDDIAYMLRAPRRRCGPVRARSSRLHHASTSTSATPTWEFARLHRLGLARNASSTSSTRWARSASTTCSCASRPLDIDELCDQIAAFGAEIGRTTWLSWRARTMPCSRCATTSVPPRSGPRRAPRSTRPRSSSTSGPTRRAGTWLVLSEHHGIDDGWMPAPLTIAGVILGSTDRASRCSSRASILPLHDPVRIAEQIAVLDNAAPGRLWTVFGAGYQREEFEMAGADHAAAARCSRSTSASSLQALDRRAVRVAGPHDHGDAEAGHATAPDDAGRRGSARGGAPGRRACASR